jgi:glycerophosphoryl diester phosphodiesterase
VPHERPLVVAHRGSSDLVPEHTLAAYQRALAEGADALECDVRLTSDGHLICVHDRRIDRTSNGRGAVSTLRLEQLDQYDFGSWHQRFPDSADELVLDRTLAEEALSLPGGDTASKVLTLATLLELVEADPRPVRLLVETKHPTRFGGLVELALVDQLRRFGFDLPTPGGQPRASVMSFSSLALRRIRDLAPMIPTVLLLDAVPVIRRDGSLPYGSTVAGPGIDVVRAHPEYVRRVQRRGNQVYVWTVDEPADLELVLSLGVSAVITNRPGRTLARLSGRDPSGRDLNGSAHSQPGEEASNGG